MLSVWREETMNDIQTIALANLVADKVVKVAKTTIGSGCHKIDPFTLTVEGGTVTIGESVEYTPTVHLPLLDVLVIALHRSGIQREGIMEVIERAALDALAEGDKVGEETKKSIAYVKGEVEALQERLSVNLPKATRSGPTKVAVKWEEK
jgi:hypothetical protein